MEHPLQINYENVDESLALNRQIGERITALERLLDQITSCHVWVRLPHRHKQLGDVYSAQINITIPSLPVLSTRSEGEEPHTTIDAAFQAMLQQIEALRPEKHRHTVRHVGLTHGTVIRLGDGPGVIEDDDGHEYLFSARDLEGVDAHHIGAGTEVQFLAVESPSGWRAQRVVLARHQFGVP